MDMKTYIDKSVYEATQERIAMAFDEFDQVLVSFSCGKDSGVMLNLCYDYAKEHGMLDKMGMYYMDYEADYEDTDKFAYRSFNENFEGIKKYWLCLPVSAQCSCSMTDQYWTPWDEDKKDLWVKQMPDSPYVINEHNVPWDFVKCTYGADTRRDFTKWYADEFGKTCVMVGIRCDESFDRMRIVMSERRVNMYKDLRYTKKLRDDLYVMYPMYDWTAEDIWTANGKFAYDYNRAYDLMYYSGMPIHEMRIASPFHMCGQASLKLFKALSPDTWGKMVSRVNGVNFMGLYGGTFATGYKKATKPEHMTWQEYANFLLNTLPDDVRERFLENIARFEKTWSEKGYGRNPQVIAQMESEGIELEHTGVDDPKCTKPGYYEIVKIKSGIPDDTKVKDFRHCPSWKAICITILKNDFTMTYMGVSRSKKDMERRRKALEKYKNL
jgi:predicted phosphoadenosine phosphosulfate sulfurtransferase